VDNANYEVPRYVIFSGLPLRQGSR